MLWVFLFIIIVISVFLWIVVLSASNSIDEETQRLLDEEQACAIEEYLREKEFKSNGSPRVYKDLGDKTKEH